MNKDEYERMYLLEDHLWWYVGMGSIARALLESAAPAHGAAGPGREHRRILDAGCGTGGAAMWLARYGEVTALDWSSDALGFCRRRRLRRLCRGSVTALPFPDGTFDLVTSFDVIYHLAVSDDEAALDEMHRVLAPGGLALIRVPAFEFLRSGHDVAVHTRHRYRRPELVAKLHAAGFEIRRASYANTLLFPLAAGRRLLQRQRGQHGESDVQPVHPLANRTLAAALALEARWLRRADLPWGLSVVALAAKPVGAASEAPAHASARAAARRQPLHLASASRCCSK